METLSECPHSDSCDDNPANPGEQPATVPVEPQSNESANVNVVEGSVSANSTCGQDDGELSQEECVLWSAVKKNPSDFTFWTRLLQKIEQKGKVHLAREVFDSFLKLFPYCYGYWKKYADFEKNNSTDETAAQVFERGVEAIPLSVDLWMHFMSFTVKLLESEQSKGSQEKIRKLYQRAVEACGLDYRSGSLWDSYLEWEVSAGSPSSVLAVYDRVLATSVQNLAQYFDRFKKFVESVPVSELVTEEQVSEMGTGSAATEKLIAKRFSIFEATIIELKKRESYEDAIKRPYFHVKPLERSQLRNWKAYLDFEIAQGNTKRILTLFERCVIACSLYEDVWRKFANYAEESCPDYAGSVYERACTIHLRQKPNIHVAWSVFEERRGNTQRARDILRNIMSLVPNLVDLRMQRISLEIRHKHYQAADELYREAVSDAQSTEARNFFSWRYARFSSKVLNNHDKSVTILLEAIAKDRGNMTLYLQLLDLEQSRVPLNDEKIEEVFNIVHNSELDNEVKHSFALRRQQYQEEFGSDINKLLSCQKQCQELKKLVSAVKRRASSTAEADSEQVKRPRLDSTGLLPDPLTIPQGPTVSQAVSTPTTAAVIQLQPGQAPPTDPTHLSMYQQNWAAYNMDQQGYNYQQYYPQYTGY